MSSSSSERRFEALPPICTRDELQEYLHVSRWWLYRHKPPRCPGVGRLLYNTRSEAFKQWLAGVINPDQSNEEKIVDSGERND